MTTKTQIAISLEAMFLSASNVRDISAFIGRPAKKEMSLWTKQRKLDDYESVQGDFTEALDYVNRQFVKLHKNKPYEFSMASGKKYPKYYIDEGVERYNVNDWRSHDAQYSQEVFRSNANFRYGNKIKQWRIGMHKRHYDREEHENGFRDIRELSNFQRGYNMKDIYAPNKYTSSDSIMYGY
jgi:hypothetical protein